jgi:hypothetical protein
VTPPFKRQWLSSLYITGVIVLSASPSLLGLRRIAL